MKSTFLLIVSLALNAGFMVAWRCADGKIFASTQLTSTSRAAKVAPSLASARGQDHRAAPAKKIWPRLETENLSTLVAQLRQAGFSPRMIRAIVVIVADTQRQTPNDKARAAAVANSKGPISFLDPLPNSIQMAAQTKREKERDALLTRLLGPEWKFDDDGFRIEMAGKFGDISPEKMLRAREIELDTRIAAYEAIPPKPSRNDGIEEDIGLPDSYEYFEPDGFFPPEVAAKLKAVGAKNRARLAALLTPEEREEHELRTHPSVESLHRDLGEFEPTELEFCALFAIRRDFDASFSNHSAETTNSERLAAEARLQAQFAAALGPERYAEYRQVTDPASTRLNHLVARLELPVSAAMQVTALQREATERANLLRTDVMLPVDQRDAQLVVLANDATKKITAILGDRGLEAYHRYGGYWLDLIPPNPLAASPAR